MTDPRLQDLTELPRRMTATLDLRALGEEITARAIEATGAATGAIALWDRHRDRLITRADLEAVAVGPRMSPGEEYARLEEYEAAGGCSSTAGPSASAPTGRRTTRPSGPGSTAGA